MPSKRFLVALSFPGERRALVAEVAEHLSEQLGRERVFYDGYMEEELAVPNLDILLQDIYKNQNLLVVPFLCSDYNKPWCRVEWSAMRPILMERVNGDTILPIRLDDGHVPGFERTHGYVDARKHSPKELADLIQSRIKRLVMTAASGVPQSATRNDEPPEKPSRTVRQPEPATQTSAASGQSRQAVKQPEASPERPPAAVVAMSSNGARPVPAGESPRARNLVSGRLAILYKRNSQPDEALLKLVESHFTELGYSVFVDRHMAIGMDWAREIEAEIRSVDAVVLLLSAASAQSEMMAYEVRVAQEAAQQRKGKPYLFPVRVNFTEKLPPELAGYLDRLQYFLWSGSDDDHRLVAELEQALRNPNPITSFRPPGGAMPLDSKLYVPRPTDDELGAAVTRGDQIVLVKGARQMGKTSLMARGLQRARQSGASVLLTDFQKLNSSDLETPTTLFLALAIWIADQLDMKVTPESMWEKTRSANVNFERYLRRHVFQEIQTPLVWGLDEVDRLFTCDYKSEVFGLFRAWVNERETNPAGPWSRLTQIITYATEPHLFITDPNQSPFNVGTRIELRDFTLGELADLNGRYGGPLHNAQELERLHRLLGGHPYLSNRGLYELAARRIDLATLEASAGRDEGPFGDHLRRMLFLLAQDAALCECVRAVLLRKPCPSAESFHRLRSAGVMAGDSVEDARFRCQVYATYLQQHLLEKRVP